MASRKRAASHAKGPTGINVEVIKRQIPEEQVRASLEATGRRDRRERELPGRVMMYYMVATGLYKSESAPEVLRIVQEGLGRTRPPASKGGISRARVRLGWQPVARLFETVARPVARKTRRRQTQGAWFGRWRVVALDGSTMDAADTPANAQTFSRVQLPDGKQGPYPQLRFVALIECGTHAPFGLAVDSYGVSEEALADRLWGHLQSDMLCLVDRNFFCLKRWRAAKATGAQLLWRVKTNLKWPVEERLSDGSYLTTVYGSTADRKHQRNGERLRVIEYCLPHVPGSEARYRLATTILDPAAASAEELGRALPRALGGRDRTGRGQNAPARPACGLAQQAAGPGPPGILRPVPGPLPRARPHARGGLAGR